MPPKIDAHIVALPATIPFVAPERTERQTATLFSARLGANEGNFGCSPMAIEAMANVARGSVGQYPDPECYELRQALCAHLGFGMDNVVIGPGIDGLLGLIVRLYSSPSDKIVTSLGAYPTFNYHVAGYDRQLITVPYLNDKENLTALAAAAQQNNAAVIYVSNPDNPMGTWWSAQEIERFIDQVPEYTLIILDEAYGETAPEGTLPELNLGRPNLLRLRTFSKAYGLAGLRCGYAFGHRDLISAFEKVRDHFGVSIMAQKAANAAIEDQAWLSGMVATIGVSRDRIHKIAQDAGLTSLQSATNFVTIDCGRDGAFAHSVLNGLMDRRIFVRKPMARGLDRCIRVSVGRPDELAAFQVALPEILDELR